MFPGVWDKRTLGPGFRTQAVGTTLSYVQGPKGELGVLQGVLAGSRGSVWSEAWGAALQPGVMLWILSNLVPQGN